MDFANERPPRRALVTHPVTHRVAACVTAFSRWPGAASPGAAWVSTPNEGPRRAVTEAVTEAVTGAVTSGVAAGVTEAATSGVTAERRAVTGSVTDVAPPVPEVALREPFFLTAPALVVMWTS